MTSASDPIVVTAYFEPAEGRKDALIEVLERFIPLVHAEDGCELYAIHDAPDGSIVMIEKWSSAAALDAHAEGEVISQFMVAIDGLLAERVRVVRLEPLPVGGAAGVL